MKIVKVIGENVEITDTKCPLPHRTVTKKFFTSFRAEAFAKVFIRNRLGARDFRGDIMTEKRRQGNVTALFTKAEDYNVDAMFRLLKKISIGH